MKKQWYQASGDAVVVALQSDREHGLAVDEAARRITVYGYNELQEKQHDSLWRKFLHQFRDFLVLILIGASVVSAATGEGVDSAVILIIVLFNALLGVFQEAKAVKALDALKQMNAPTAKLIRNGTVATIPSREVVPGDIIILEAGGYIPADLRLLDVFNLKIDEASLTGESVSVEKDCQIVGSDPGLGDLRNMGFMGTVVTGGRGTGIVTATGMNTEIGKIATMLQAVQKHQTPLQVKLEQFGKMLGAACLGICILVFIIGLWPYWQNGSLSFAEIQSLLMISISLAVAAIPEGLPAVVTVVLALGMQRLAKQNALVKKLHAIETLGSVSVICSDKTGTLTQNQMTVVKILAGNKLYAVTGEGYTPEGQFINEGQVAAVSDEYTLSLLLQGSLLCNDVRLQCGNSPGNWIIDGDPTEGALAVAAYKAGYKAEELNAQFSRVQELPFDADRKMMTTIHHGEQGFRAFVKGAPDMLLSRCVLQASDKGVIPLGTHERSGLIAANRELASQALRVLAVAYRDFDTLPNASDLAAVETDLVFIGLLGMIDPPRAEAKAAVAVCRSAGIRPVMITGDHHETAFAVAKELDIATTTDQVVTGRQLSSLTPWELRQTVRTASVFARVSPAHKVAIVEALRSEGQIVAMTGDGVNDAPSLKQADIGVAMGITGTDVAKGAADMVIGDDNFATIVAAVEEGRIIYANIQKFVYFLVSCNISEILVIFFAILWGWPLPLLPVQLLWVNLVTDAFPALALGMEKREPDVMKSKPRSPTAPLLDRQLTVMIAVQSIAIAVTVLGAFQYVLAMSGQNVDLARTYAFAILVMAQIICAYGARSTHNSVFALGIFSNMYLNGGALLSFVLLTASLYAPLSEFFKTVSPGLNDWLLIAMLSPLPFVAVELTKKVLGGKSGRGGS